METLIADDAKLETLGEGFVWSEGPVWVEGALLFTDVPSNTIHRWTETGGVETFLTPSGVDLGADPTEVDGGVNGMIRAAEPNAIVGADHKGRNVFRLDLATKARTVLAERYDGKRFNSPNDVALAADGAIYFTDPPYGLTRGDESPLKELPFNGVYRLAPDGAVTLLDDTLTRPNGIALSPDGGTLYVANSDPAAALWVAYDVIEGGGVANRRTLFDATEAVTEGVIGLPDGMTIAANGGIFATGPGGVYVFTPEGGLIGIIETPAATANVTFGGDDGRTLYIAVHDKLMRIPVAVRGAGF